MVKKAETFSGEREINLFNAASRIRRCMKVKKPVFLWGAPGIGKSELVKQVTDEIGGVMIDFRLAIRQPTDLIGIPFKSIDANGNHIMDWAPPIDLPSAQFAAKHKIVILFLDEMNSAPPSVQAAAYQLVLDRKVGKYSLPDNVVIVAAGNRQTDGGVTYRMPTPLKNRFVHLNVKVDFETWRTWAVKKNVHRDIVGFLSHHSSKLMDENFTSSPSNAFATPRSWVALSTIIGEDDISHDELSDLAVGTVGEGVATEFLAHRKFAYQLPNPNDVLLGKVTKLDTKETSAHYSLIIGMCYALKESNDKKEKNFNDKLKNFANFLMNEFTQELQIVAFTIALRTYKITLNPQIMGDSFKRFNDLNSKYIMGAHQIN
jgi:hypothetical protein